MFGITQQCISHHVVDDIESSPVFRHWHLLHPTQAQRQGSSGWEDANFPLLLGVEVGGTSHGFVR